MDPQANLTAGLGINLNTVERSMADVLADGRATLDEVVLADGDRRHRCRAGAHRSRVDRGRAVHRPRSRADPARGARGPDRRLRLRPHRLPAEPRPADRQRPGRREQRDHPGPDAVLRDEGPDQPRQGHQRDPPQAEPRPADPGPAADVLRRPHEPRPRHARRAARRRRPPRLQQHRPQHREARRGAARRTADHGVRRRTARPRGRTASSRGR